MVSNHKVTGRTFSIPAGIALGTLGSMVVTIFLAALIAWMVKAEHLPPENIGYGIMLLLAIASFTGAWIAWNKIKRKRLMVCLLSGAAYFTVLLSMTALFFGGQYAGVGETALMILCGCLLRAMWTGHTKSRAYKHTIRKHRC